MTTVVRGESVVYIDTCASFSARRLAILFRHSSAAQQVRITLLTCSAPPQQASPKGTPLPPNNSDGDALVEGRREG